ncbi:MAG: GreA/GreB family elongation factor [Pseudomonadota bacterium]|nr:GreA/GreB family elongation factor [Pseudomonadota bacterium]
MSLRLANRLDAERLQRLIDDADDKDRAVADLLEALLERAEILDPDEMPDDVVSMNSQVVLRDLDEDRQLVRTLVYPHALSATTDGLSVMAPLGAELLTRRVGEQWQVTPLTGRTKRWQLEKILWQPERERQFHR